MFEEEEKKEEAEAEAPAEGEGEEGAEGEGGKKKSSKLLLIAIPVVLILIAVPVILFFTGVIGGSSEEEIVAEGEQIEAVEGEGGEEVAEGEEGTEGAEGTEGVVSDAIVYYDLEEFVVNLNVGSKRPSFLKMSVSLEIKGESQIVEIEERMPRIRDSFQTYLRELRVEDLQGSAGIYRLREELLLRINKMIHPAFVNDILFKEILVQ